MDHSSDLSEVFRVTVVETIGVSGPLEIVLGFLQICYPAGLVVGSLTGAALEPVAGGATHGQTGEFPLAGGRTSQPAHTDWSLPSGQAADHARTLVPLSLRQLLQILEIIRFLEILFQLLKWKSQGNNYNLYG